MGVTLTQMLEAREARAFRQFQLNREWQKPLISFSMNIPGPVKISPLISRGFHSGCERLEKLLPAGAIVHQEFTEGITGCEAIYVIDMMAEAIKTITTEIEDTHPLGRLFDMDVLDTQLTKLDRENFGGGNRNCIVCGAPGRGCASRRIHSVSALQASVTSILKTYFAQVDAEKIGSLAVNSLIDEVKTTPKPGLVDCCNNGSHRDMDIHTFLVSANALAPYFRQCARIGMDTSHLSPQETFSHLRMAGLAAEKAMFDATGGINTHKGAIFTMGILCGAAGRLWTIDARWQEDAIFREVSVMTKTAMKQDFHSMTGRTSGEQLYASRGIQGIRGEVSLGLPSVAGIGLPAYRNYRKEGHSQNDAGALTLLHLIAHVEDTCLIHRGGLEGAREAVKKVSELLPAGPGMVQIKELDTWFIQQNLSPGGSADLLAATYFMDYLCRENEASEL